MISPLHVSFNRNSLPPLLPNAADRYSGGCTKSNCTEAELQVSMWSDCRSHALLIQHSCAWTTIQQLFYFKPSYIGLHVCLYNTYAIAWNSGLMKQQAQYLWEQSNIVFMVSALRFCILTLIKWSVPTSQLPPPQLHLHQTPRIVWLLPPQLWTLILTIWSLWVELQQFWWYWF